MHFDQLIQENSDMSPCQPPHQAEQSLIKNKVALDTLTSKKDKIYQNENQARLHKHNSGYHQ